MAANNPWTNPALACELTLRERQALMTQDDWDLLIGKALDALLDPFVNPPSLNVEGT